jgi:hypothetical protein
LTKVHFPPEVTCSEVFLAHVQEAAADAGTRLIGWLCNPVDHPGAAGILELIGLRWSMMGLKLMTSGMHRC